MKFHLFIYFPIPPPTHTHTHTYICCVSALSTVGGSNYPKLFEQKRGKSWRRKKKYHSEKCKIGGLWTRIIWRLWYCNVLLFLQFDKANICICRRLLCKVTDLQISVQPDKNRFFKLKTRYQLLTSSLTVSWDPLDWHGHTDGDKTHEMNSILNMFKSALHLCDPMLITQGDAAQRQTSVASAAEWRDHFSLLSLKELLHPHMEKTTVMTSPVSAVRKVAHWAVLTGQGRSCMTANVFGLSIQAVWKII